MPPDREVMTRNAFRRTALETRCQLYFPGPDEDIVLLRTGFLKHIQVPYRSLLGAYDQLQMQRWQFPNHAPRPLPEPDLIS